MPSIEDLTTKQFGDACEYATLAELGFAGHAAVKMPDANPGYDLVLVDKLRTRISVRGLRAGPRSGGGRKLAGYWTFDPDNFDWLVLIRVNIETGQRRSYVLPQEVAIALSKPRGDGKRRMNFRTPKLAPWADNFARDRPSVSLKPN
jgi:hypothetical protein